MSKGKKIEPREDVNPQEGIRKYGDVEFADPVNHKYPLDTPSTLKQLIAISTKPIMRLSIAPQK